MAAEDIGKINPQLRGLMDDVIRRIESMSYDEMGEFSRIMVEGARHMVQERDRAIRELAPEIFWIEGLLHPAVPVRSSLGVSPLSSSRSFQTEALPD